MHTFEHTRTMSAAHKKLDDLSDVDSDEGDITAFSSTAITFNDKSFLTRLMIILR